MTLRTKLWLIYASEFWVFFHLFGGVLIPFFTEWGGLSLTQIMLLQGWFSFCILLFEIPTGTLADKIGRKNTLYLGLLAWFIGIVIYGYFRDFWVYVVAEMFWGMAFSLFSGAKEALIYDTLLDHGQEKRSQEVFSNFKMSHLLGLMVSAPLGSWIGSTYGLEWSMRGMLVALIIAALFLVFLPEPKSAKSYASDGHSPSSRPESQQTFKKQITAGWRYFRQHPYLSIMAFDMVTIWSLAFMIIWFHQLVLDGLGVSVEYFGWFITFSLLMQMTVLKLYPWMEKVLGSKKQVLGLAGFFPGLGFLLLAFYPHVVTVLAALVLCGAFGLTRRTLYSSYVNKFIPSAQRATVNSFINIGIHLVAFLIKPGLGYLADSNLNATFILLGVGCILVTAFSRVEEDMLLD